MLAAFAKGSWRHLVVALGLVHLLGGPVMLLQGVAWLGMLVSYSAEDGLVRGVTDTFSGERPCALCLKVREMEREAPGPALPERGDPRRLVDSLAQSLALTDEVELPRAATGNIDPLATRLRNTRRPEDPVAVPDVPPPRAGA